MVEGWLRPWPLGLCRQEELRLWCVYLMSSVSVGRYWYLLLESLLAGPVSQGATIPLCMLFWA